MCVPMQIPSALFAEGGDIPFFLLTLQPLEHAVHGARAPAAGHGDVEFVGVVACFGGDGGCVGHFGVGVVGGWFGVCVGGCCWR